MREFFDSVLDFFFQILDLLHTGLEPVFGDHAWGWSIIALTLLVRVALLPLAIKQTRSMRAMQALQPQIKELQKKYKVDRDLMRKDPETYRARRQKLSEEQMALFKREGANPAASCLPILAQAPIFIALFWMLRGQSDPGDPLFDAPFYFFTNFITQDTEAAPSGLAALVSSAGWPGWLLIVLMSGSMFITSRQMMARNSAMGTDGPSQQMQMQKMIMYVMPVFLAVVSFNFPLGILLYWVTTNMWQIAQQWIILREVKHEAETGELASKPGGQAAARNKPKDEGKKPRKSPGASSGRSRIKPGDDVGGSTNEGSSSTPKKSDRPSAGKGDGADGKGAKGTNGSKPAGGKRSGGSNGERGGASDAGSEGGSGGARGGDHLPRRGGGTS